MKQSRMFFCAAAMLSMAATLFAQHGTGGQGQAIVTVVPNHSTEQAPAITQQDIKTLKVGGKPAEVTGFRRLGSRPVELVLLIDSGARTSMGTQLSEFASFIKEMPPNMRMTVGYMLNGRAVLSGPLSSDPATVLKGLHIPVGTVDSSASPYFCLSDLAKNWPSRNRAARREVVMVTDGIDYYNLRYDPDDPYVQAAITDSVRAGLVVYSLYWMDKGRIDRTGWAQDAGQSLLLEVTDATGGNSYWMGFGNPVSFQPYLQDLRHRLVNQYELSFNAPLRGKAGVEQLDLKLSVPGAKVDVQKQVYVYPVGEARQ